MSLASSAALSASAASSSSTPSSAPSLPHILVVDETDEEADEEDGDLDEGEIHASGQQSPAKRRRLEPARREASSESSSVKDEARLGQPSPPPSLPPLWTNDRQAKGPIASNDDDTESDRSAPSSPPSFRSRPSRAPASPPARSSSLPRLEKQGPANSTASQQPRVPASKTQTTSSRSCSSSSSSSSSPSSTPLASAPHSLPSAHHFHDSDGQQQNIHAGQMMYHPAGYDMKFSAAQSSSLQPAPMQPDHALLRMHPLFAHQPPPSSDLAMAVPSSEVKEYPCRHECVVNEFGVRSSCSKSFALRNSRSRHERESHPACPWDEPCPAYQFRAGAVNQEERRKQKQPELASDPSTPTTAHHEKDRGRTEAEREVIALRHQLGAAQQQLMHWQQKDAGQQWQMSESQRTFGGLTAQYDELTARHGQLLAELSELRQQWDVRFSQSAAEVARMTQQLKAEQDKAAAQEVEHQRLIGEAASRDKRIQQLQTQAAQADEKLQTRLAAVQHEALKAQSQLRQEKDAVQSQLVSTLTQLMQCQSRLHATEQKASARGGEGATIKDEVRSEKEKERPDSLECHVCMERRVDTRLPCGHALCSKCAKAKPVRRAGCPSCLAPYHKRDLLKLQLNTTA